MINHKNKIKISARFWPIFDFELNEKRSRAEPKNLQLELWLEPARLGLITRKYATFKLITAVGKGKEKNELLFLFHRFLC